MGRAASLPLRYAEGSWLTARLMAVASGTALAISALAAGAGILGAKGVLDPLGRPLGTDFASFWSAGWLAVQGRAAEAYDWTALRDIQLNLLGTELFFPWNYPPLFLLLAAALARFDYLPALFLWQGASLFLAFLAYRRVLSTRLAALVALGCPAVFLCLAHGQTGLLTAALLLGGVLALPRREILAGVLFGALAFKPQLGLLIPVFLAVGGYWRAFAAAAATLVALVALSIGVFGAGTWAAFVRSLGTTQAIVLANGGAGFEKFQSVFAWARLWGSATFPAYALQGVYSALVTAFCVALWRSPVDMRLKGAGLLLGTLLVTPYVLDYDMVVLGAAMALIVSYGQEHGFRPWLKTTLAVAWLLPGAARSINLLIPLPVTPLLLTALLMLVLREARGARGRMPIVALEPNPRAPLPGRSSA